MSDTCTAPLTMIQIRTDLGALISFAHRRRLNLRDLDLGYAIHSWTSEVWADRAPAPFSWTIDQQQVTILGYSFTPPDDIVRCYHDAAKDLTACSIGEPACKIMPDSWPQDRMFAYQVRVCPTRRLSRRGQGLPPAPEDGQARALKPGAEIDAWQHHLARCRSQGVPNDLQRSEVYRAWFTDRWEDDAAELISWSEDGLQRARLQRRGKNTGDGHRPARTVTLPALSCSGLCRIRDANAFQRLLARGIGRHRAFGFGMILLKPA